MDGNTRSLLRVLDRCDRIEKDRQRQQQRRAAERAALHTRYLAYQAQEAGDPVPWEN